MSGKKNLHEGKILYFGLEVCKKTGTKRVKKVKSFLQEASNINWGTVMMFAAFHHQSRLITMV